MTVLSALKMALNAREETDVCIMMFANCQHIFLFGYSRLNSGNFGLLAVFIWEIHFTLIWRWQNMLRNQGGLSEDVKTLHKASAFKDDKVPMFVSMNLFLSLEDFKVILSFHY